MCVFRDFNREHLKLKIADENGLVKMKEKVANLAAFLTELLSSLEWKTKP